MLINREILKTREDWRVYYILEHLRENKYVFHISSDDDLLNILYFVYQKNKELSEVAILKFLNALELVLFDEYMKNDEITITLELLYNLRIYKKMRELEEE